MHRICHHLICCKTFIKVLDDIPASYHTCTNCIIQQMRWTMLAPKWLKLQQDVILSVEYAQVIGAAF